jgi:hypothetical protein
MLKLMQSASALTVAAAIALGPGAVIAQTTPTEGGSGAATGETGAQDPVILPDEGDAPGTADTAQTQGSSGEGAAVPGAETAQGGATAPADPGAEPAPGVDPGTQAAEIEGEAPVAPVEGTIRMQDQDTFLASDLMGARLYNAADENVGTVDDVIVSTGGQVEGVVIGVGGFLGIGEKRVAVEMAQISVQTDETGNPRLLLDATRESLEAAPEFVTMADQARDLDVRDVAPTQGQSGAASGEGGTAGAPAAD